MAISDATRRGLEEASGSGLSVRPTISLQGTTDTSGGLVAENPGPSVSGARYIGAATETTKKTATFTVGENVRAYQIIATTTASSGVRALRVAEDAADSAQADILLTAPTASASAGVGHYRQKASATVNDTVEGAWQEISKNPDDSPLTRLDVIVEAATSGTVDIFVRTR